MGKMLGERANRHLRLMFGQRLRVQRQLRHLSQERLGDRSDLSGKFIGEVERGEKSISLDSIQRICQALAVPMTELLRINGQGRSKLIVKKR